MGSLFHADEFKMGKSCLSYALRIQFPSITFHSLHPCREFSSFNREPHWVMSSQNTRYPPLIGTANAMWWWEREECWNMKLRPSLWCFVFGSDELKMNVILRKKKKLWSLLHTHGIRCALVWSPKDTFHNLKLKSRKEIFFFVFGHRNWGGNEIKYDMGWLGKVRQSGHAA